MVICRDDEARLMVVVSISMRARDAVMVLVCIPSGDANDSVHSPCARWHQKGIYIILYIFDCIRAGESAETHCRGALFYMDMRSEDFGPRLSGCVMEDVRNVRPKLGSCERSSFIGDCL